MLLRGTQKKILYVKSTGGTVFDEAFFVLKDGREDEVSAGDIIGEANRIIEEHTARTGKKKERCEKTFPPFLLFLFGMCLSAALFFTFYFCYLK